MYDTFPLKHSNAYWKNLPFLPSLFCGVTCDPCDPGCGGGCTFCIEVVFWNVAMAMILRLWLHSFVTSSAHLMSLGVQGFDWRLGSKWKTRSSSSGHSRPHLHVPSISRYWHIWLAEVRRASLGLQPTTTTHHSTDSSLGDWAHSIALCRDPSTRQLDG